MRHISGYEPRSPKQNLKDLKENGLLIIDSSLVKTVPEVKAKIYSVPASELFQKTYANMIILGALTKALRIVSQEALEKAISDTVEEKYVNANLQAYKMGTALIA